MNAKRLPNGNLLVPMRAEDKKSGIVGDGMVEAKPGTKLYNDWLPFVAAPTPKSGRARATRGKK